MKTLKIGTRDSRLALVQTQLVCDALQAAGVATQMIAMKTTGDKILNVTLDKIGGKGLFVKELDDALLSGAVDVTVHSFKDMPMEVPPALPIVAVSAREDARDVLIARADAEITAHSVIGCSSQRRTVQLKALGYPNIKVLRGNVQTRLQKLDCGEYDAIVLAAAGINRLGLQHRITRFFTVEEIMPAACQGVLAVQAANVEVAKTLAAFHCANSAITTAAERAFVRHLGGGCSSPIAAYATLQGDVVTLQGMYVSANGTILKGEITGTAEQAEAIGIALAQTLRGAAHA